MSSTSTRRPHKPTTTSTSGLFTVFQDNPSSTSRSSSSSTTSTTTRRKPLGKTDQNNNNGGDEWKGKENFDPFAHTLLKSLGKNKLGSKSSCVEGGGVVSGRKTTALSSSSVSVNKSRQAEGALGGGGNKALPSRMATKMSDNKICTGTLRTRILPSSSSSSSSETIQEDASIAPPPPPALRPSSRQSILSSTTTTINDSPSSARDSGYAEDSGDSSWDLDVSLVSSSGMDQDEDEEETVTILGPSPPSRRTVVINVKEANRRARGLTESPLAEVTQAYTSNGSFSLPPNSPTPTPSLSSTRLPSSSSSSSTRTKPYPTPIHPISNGKTISTTTTTRRVKPSSSAATTTKGEVRVEDLGKGVKTMRF